MQRLKQSERSVPKNIPKQHKYDLEGSGVLTEKEQKAFGFDMEICAECGKEIHFNLYMSRGSYTYKRTKNGKVRYYCGYNHYLRG